mmetsp:Transcript_40932/g.101756  ORF Transcript_40932/g.101756 Transcript_40932/m.101756 type:complete len:253 (+) Transcript_40932:1683-2441(+)
MSLSGLVLRTNTGGVPGHSFSSTFGKSTTTEPPFCPKCHIASEASTSWCRIPARRGTDQNLARKTSCCAGPYFGVICRCTSCLPVPSGIGMTIVSSASDCDHVNPSPRPSSGVGDSIICLEAETFRMGSGFGGGGGGVPSSNRSGRLKRLACESCASSASTIFFRCLSVSFASPIVPSVCFSSSGSRLSFGCAACARSALSCARLNEFGREFSQAEARAERSSPPSFSLVSLARPEIIEMEEERRTRVGGVV